MRIAARPAGETGAGEPGHGEPGIGASTADRASLGRTRTSRLAGFAAVALVLLTAGALWLVFREGNAGPVPVAAPKVAAGRVTAECAALTNAAPRRVYGQTRRQTDPLSPLTAAWGSPAIVLRCGVSKPAVLVPGSAQYDPAAEEIYANGLAWLYQQTSSGYQFVTAQRAIYVEVDVPGTYPQNHDIDALDDLTPAILKTVPTGNGTYGPDPAPANAPSP